VVNVQNVDNAAVLVDPVDDAIGAAQGAVTTGERPEQRLADPLRVGRKRASQNSSTAAATASGSRWAIARRTAGWNRVSYRCAGSAVTCR
jgi:hypothetical protein